MSAARRPSASLSVHCDKRDVKAETSAAVVGFNLHFNTLAGADIMIANEHSVAMFGSFTYKTRTLGKEITSPFALLAKVTGDKISYIQFLEDTFGTASTFRAGGTWHFRGVATGGDVSVGS
jgi:hypothetical protein